VDAKGPPAEVLREAGLVLLPGRICPREGPAWRVDWHGTPGVLRQVPAPAPGPVVDDVIWRHAFLARLDFPAPRPLACFDGRSWAAGRGAVWELVSFLPGQAVGWAAEPPMEDIGALLARYHAAARRVNVAGQRPGALPLADVPAVLLSPELEIAKRVRAGRAETGVLAQVQRTSANAGAVGDALAAAVS
jgi:Phosphotransferase enzyme family